MCKLQGRYPALKITVTTADEESLLLFFYKFGGQVRRVKMGSQPAKRQLFSWQKHGREAQKVLKELLPFLVAKQEVAFLALLPNFEDWGHGKKMPQEELDLRCDVRERISQINNRITVQSSLLSS